MILVSSCLLGLCCRYDGKEKAYDKVLEYLKDKTYIPICPEQMGGLATPRGAAEIVSQDPLKIMTEDGLDVTEAFQRGVREVLKLANSLPVEKAILKSLSPSCGSYKIYDGTFTRNLVEGSGIVSKALKELKIDVINEEDL